MSRRNAPWTFESRGFLLYLPPTPLTTERSRFVMWEGQRDAFYDIDYETPLLNNTRSWHELNMHLVSDPAIVLPPPQRDMLELMLREHGKAFAQGHLVSITHRDDQAISATILGNIAISIPGPDWMNWNALIEMKGPVLPAEMRGGLMQTLWNRRAFPPPQPITYQTPVDRLNQMPRPWHRDGAVLNDELDRIFIAGHELPPTTVWRLSR